MTTATTNEIISIEDMRALYDGEWVLVIDLKADAGYRVLSGRVASHNVDKEVVEEVAAEMQPVESALLFLGVPTAADIIL